MPTLPAPPTASVPGSAAAAIASTASTLSLYWELASVDPAVRVKAAETLISVLHSLQSTHSADCSGGPITAENLSQRCPSDVVYGLKRLLRGLPSSRDGARQGFALALTELLSMLPDLKVETVLDLLESFTITTGGMKGQEQREMLFGRLFGIRAIVLSGILSRPHTTTADIDRIISYLNSFAESKVYLRQASFDILISVVEMLSSDSHHLNDHLMPVLQAILKENIDAPEELWLAVFTQNKVKDSQRIDWNSLIKGWKYPENLLHPAHKTQLSTILKETSSSIPNLHSVWSCFADVILASSVTSFDIQDFWTLLVDPLFTSSHERKYVGFQVFQHLLPRLSAEQVPFIFSANFMSCFINNLSTTGNYLHKLAKATAKQINNVCNANKTLSFPVLLQLIGKHGNQRFDAITKTKTVATLLESSTQQEIEGYTQHLMDVFVDQSKYISSDDESYNKSIDSHRLWSIEQMLQLIRNTKISKSESWILSIIKFLCLHSLFTVEGTNSSDIHVPVPAVSDSTREQCKVRLLSALGDLNSLVLKGDKDVKLPQGTMASGEFWIYYVMNYITELDSSFSNAGNNVKLSLVQRLNSDSKDAKEAALKSVGRFREQVKKSDGKLVSEYKAFELLFLHVLLDMYYDQSESVGVLEELQKCSTMFFEGVIKNEDSPIASKKRKATESAETDGENPNPIDVIIDILLSFLAKSSVLLRGVAEHVFKVFCSRLTETAMDLIFDILTAKSGVAGAEELFEDEDQDMEGQDDDVINSDDEMDDIKQDDDENNEEEQEDEEEEEEEEGEESSEEENDDLSEEDASDVDEEFRKKVQAALGKYAVTEATESESDDDDEEEEEFVGDDEMGAFDEKLAEIFKEKKRLKVQKRDTKQQVLHFKIRVIDLLELFIKNQSANPLIIKTAVSALKVALSTSESEESRDLNIRIVSFIKAKLTKMKEFPPIDLESGISSLKEVHELAALAPSASTVGLCSIVSIMIVKSLARHAPESMKMPLSTAVESASVSKKGKKQKLKPNTEILADTPSHSPVATIYLKSFVEFLTSKKSKLHPSIFLELANRYPSAAFELVPDMLELVESNKIEKGYKLVQGFNFTALVLSKIPNKDNQSQSEIMKSFIPKYSNVLIKIIERFLSESEGSKNIDAERIKEVLKASLKIARRLRSIINSDDEFKNLWQFASLDSTITSALNSGKFTKPSELTSLRQFVSFFTASKSNKKSKTSDSH